MTSEHEPIHGADVAWLQGEGIVLHTIDAGQGGHFFIESGPVDRDNLGSKPGERPCPASGAGAGVQADISGARHRSGVEEGFPQFPVGAGRRAYFVLDEGKLAVGKRAGTGGRA